jgi:hypothetical protein
LRFAFASLLSVLALLWKENRVDVWKHTALSNRDVTEEFVELFVVADCELQVTRNDSGLLVVAGCVSCEFEDFSCEVLEDCCEVDWCSRESDE